MRFLFAILNSINEVFYSLRYGRMLDKLAERLPQTYEEYLADLDREWEIEQAMDRAYEKSGQQNGNA